MSAVQVVWAAPVRGVRRLRRLSAGALIGWTLLLLIVGFAFLGPLFAPYSIAEPIAAPGLPPGPGALLGTDFLGRDVLSRMMNGGQELLLVAIVATALTYLVGISLGMLAGYSGSFVDPLVMRGVDLVLAFPALLFLLVLIGAAGAGTPVIVVGTVVVMAPGIIRTVRSATLTVVSRGYVEAAAARGESTFAILRREILPSILPTVVADMGLRFSGVVILIASLGYLGLGAQPPAANWALMVSENQPVMSTNPWAVLAPGLLICALSVAVNLIGDAYVASLGRSEAGR